MKIERFEDLILPALVLKIKYVSFPRNLSSHVLSGERESRRRPRENGEPEYKESGCPIENLGHDRSKM